jgi:uncharacterized protein (UPF0332 family)
MSLDECLEKGLIRKADSAYRVEGSIKIANHFLERANGSYKIEYFDTAFLMGYNSMFHSARALLFSKGYTERSHACLVIFLKHAFEANTNIIQYINVLNTYRTFRESIQYSGDVCSETDAKEIIKDARDFLKEVKTLLEK